MMSCLSCRSDGINNAHVVERRIETLGHKPSAVRHVCKVCSTPVSCRTFGNYDEKGKFSLVTDDILIQFLDKGHTWRTAAITINQSQRIISEMRSIQSRYPDSRVRAVNKAGQLIDLLD
jgi:hypothetical protein